jgi:hypothetical protein
MRLGHFKVKAVSVREKIRKLNLGENARTSDRSSSIVSGGGSSEDEGLSAYLVGDTGGDELGLDSDADEWTALVQGFQPNSSDVFWQSIQL